MAAMVRWLGIAFVLIVVIAPVRALAQAETAWSR